MSHVPPPRLVVFLASLLIATHGAEAVAACPSPYSGSDCVDAHAHSYCTLSSGEYTCSAVIASQTTSSILSVTSDSGDSTYAVYGTDTESADFCCSVAASSVTDITIHGGGGDDIINDYSLCGIGGGAEGLSVRVYAAGGADIIGGTQTTCTDVTERFHGGPGDDLIGGEGRTAEIYGDEGADYLLDLGDTVYTATLQCTIYGGADEDWLESYSHLGTVMLGGDHQDWMEGGPGPDDMHGGNGDDHMSGWDGDDAMFGDAGEDIVAGDDGTDDLHGGPDQDVVCGGGGSYDTVYGGAANDTLDDDDASGYLYGESDWDTCDSVTTNRTGCEVFGPMSYQCGAY